MAQPEPRLNASGYVYNQIRNAIITGELGSGHSIKQDEIALRFGVSKIPVREALVQLEAEGFVTLLPGRSASVARLSLEEAEEIYLMRIALEPILLERSIPRLDTLDLNYLAGVIQALDSNELAPAAWHQLDREFHSGLYQVANLPRIQATVAALHGNLARYYAVFRSVSETFEQHGQKEHRAILAACQEKRIALAVELLNRHLIRSCKSILAELQKTK